MMETPPVHHSAGDELIIGYAPAFHGVADWRLVFRQVSRLSDGVVVRRVIFGHARDPRMRILVDVAEGRTARDAELQLAAVKLDSNVRVKTGPEKLGPSSFVHGKEQPTSVNFSRANLAIWVYSSGLEHVSADPWVDRILEDLDPVSTSGSNQGLVLKPAARIEGFPDAIALAVPPETGEWAWWKFKAEGGMLSRANQPDQVILWPASGREQVAVSAWAIEPGRDTRAGRYSTAL
jgi:hypothetical protein